MKGIGKMKVVVACGGTGGHAFPGLAVAEEIAKRGHEVVVWTSGRDIESSVMTRWQGASFATGARQLSAKNALANLCAIFRCRREIKRFNPDAILAMGSYSSLPPVLAARSCGVPVYLHEANTVPGKAVDFLSRFAKKVAISFDMTANYLPDVETVKTGLPMRAEITGGKRFDFIPADSFVVFVTGGSQGAHAVNELMTGALSMMKGELERRGAKRKLYVIHQTGAADEGSVMGAYAQVSLPSRVHAFEREMANAFASADVVVARAGASTCFELAACAKPALLIPLPTSMRDHQHYNADAFASKGAADEGRQDKLSARQICRYLLDKYDHPEKLAAMADKIKAFAVPDAAARVADIIIGSRETPEIALS
jgi:UDP-N-acetylglucosamine--N-acetylmuramyl-(pentapeptide) pyrophosphoryl-undecaprenol N-acetylglucosamine transferase